MRLSTELRYISGSATGFFFSASAICKSSPRVDSPPSCRITSSTSLTIRSSSIPVVPVRPASMLELPPAANGVLGSIL